MTWTSFSELLLNGAFKEGFGFARGLSLCVWCFHGTPELTLSEFVTLNVTSLCLNFRLWSGEEPNSTPSSQSNTTAPLIDTESCIMSLTGRFWASLNVVPTVLYMMLLCFQVQTMTQSAVTCRYRLTMLMTKLGTSILLFWLTTATLSTPFLDNGNAQQAFPKSCQSSERELPWERGHALKILNSMWMHAWIWWFQSTLSEKKKRKSDLVFSDWAQASGERIKRLQRGFFSREKLQAVTN